MRFLKFCEEKNWNVIEVFIDDDTPVAYKVFCTINQILFMVQHTDAYPCSFEDVKGLNVRNVTLEKRWNNVHRHPIAQTNCLVCPHTRHFEEDTTDIRNPHSLPSIHVNHQSQTLTKQDMIVSYHLSKVLRYHRWLEKTNTPFAMHSAPFLFLCKPDQTMHLYRYTVIKEQTVRPVLLFMTDANGGTSELQNLTKQFITKLDSSVETNLGTLSTQYDMNNSFTKQARKCLEHVRDHLIPLLQKFKDVIMDVYTNMDSRYKIAMMLSRRTNNDLCITYEKILQILIELECKTYDLTISQEYSQSILHSDIKI